MSFSSAMQEMIEEMDAAVQKYGGRQWTVLWMSEAAYEMYRQAAFGRERILPPPQAEDRFMLQSVPTGFVSVRPAVDLAGERMRLGFGLPVAADDPTSQRRVQTLIEDLHNAAVMAFGGFKNILWMSASALEVYNEQVKGVERLIVPDTDFEGEGRSGGVIKIRSKDDLIGDSMRFEFGVGELGEWGPGGFPDADCLTLPDGACVSPDPCMHSVKAG